MRLLLVCICTATLLAARIPDARAQIDVYHDRATFLAALSGLRLDDDFESYAAGDIAAGDVRGAFRYTYDDAVVQPAVVADGLGGQVLGASPFEVFVGGDLVTLTAGVGSALTAFGADFLYAPSFDAIPADTYRLGVGSGPASGEFVGNPGDIDPNGGSFFLGLIAASGFEFNGVVLYSVQADSDFLVPAYQVDNLVYGVVPEPGPLTLLLGAASGALALARRRSHRHA